MWPASVRLNVWTRWSLSLSGLPLVSSRVQPLKPTVSTISVSPSHLAIDSPNQVGFGSSACVSLNGTTWNQELCSNMNATYRSFCMIWIGYGEFIDRVNPNGMHMPV